MINNNRRQRLEEDLKKLNKEEEDIKDKIADLINEIENKKQERIVFKKNGYKQIILKARVEKSEFEILDHKISNFGLIIEQAKNNLKDLELSLQEIQEKIKELLIQIRQLNVKDEKYIYLTNEN